MYEPVFVPLPDSPAEWWRSLRRFVAAWHEVSIGSTGDAADDVVALEARVGGPISRAFHEWSAFHRDLEAAGVCDVAMRDRYLVTDRADIGALTLLTLREGDVLWGVPESHLGDADPGVTAWLRGTDSAGDEHWSVLREWTRTTTGFVLEHLLSYVRGTAGGFSTELPDGATAGSVLTQICDNQVDLGHHILYEGPDILATLGGSLWAADEDGIHLGVELGSSWVGRVPEALLGLASDGGWFHGAFVRR